MEDIKAIEGYPSLVEASEKVLRSVGEDVSREGLVDTPHRMAKMYLEMTEGLRVPEPTFTLFDRGENDQMVTVLDIDYFSMCEHHMAPFFGKVHIGYLPDKHLAGLSKFARVVEWFSRRPQIQEKLTAQIVDFCQTRLNSRGIIVVVEGTHLCMAMRGVKKQNHKTVTSAIRGNGISKEEFFSILALRDGK
jgi:GTP cyclohydrolase IA